MFVILSGEVAVSQHSVLGRDQPIVTCGPGWFLGELAQLSGRPALVDAVARRSPSRPSSSRRTGCATSSSPRPSSASGSCARSSCDASGCSRAGWEDPQRAARLWRTYVAHGPVVPFARTFGYECPDPDFAGAQRLAAKLGRFHLPRKRTLALWRPGRVSRRRWAGWRSAGSGDPPQSPS